MVQKTLRQLVHEQLHTDVGLTASQVSARIKVDPKRVATTLSSMVKLNRGVRYEKPRLGEYGKYFAVSKSGTANVSLKLAQLRSSRDRLFESGLTMVDDVIADYERLL